MHPTSTCDQLQLWPNWNTTRGPSALHQRARCAECVRCCALHVVRSSCCALCYGENECRRSWAMCSKRPHRFKSSSPHPSQRPLRQLHTQPPPSSRRLYTYSSLKRRLAGAQRLPSRTARRFASPSVACSLAEALGQSHCRSLVAKWSLLSLCNAHLASSATAHPLTRPMRSNATSALPLAHSHLRTPTCTLPLAHSHVCAPACTSPCGCRRNTTCALEHSRERFGF